MHQARSSLSQAGFITRSSAPFSTAHVVYLPSQPLWELSLRAAGICAFLALALIGCFYMISKKFGSPRAFVFIAVGVIPAILGFSRAFGAFLVPERWVFLSQILYAVPLGVTLLVCPNIRAT